MTTNGLIKCLGLLSCLCWVACGSSPSPERYAAKFCECSEDIARATVQLQSKQIEQTAFDQIKQEHEACMGEDSPLTELATAEDSLAFFQGFFEEIKKQCPNIGRNYGYQID